MKYGSKLCSYLYWAERSKVPLDISHMIEREPRMFKMCEMIGDLKVYTKFGAHEFMTVLPSYEFILTEI